MAARNLVSAQFLQKNQIQWNKSINNMPRFQGVSGSIKAKGEVEIPITRDGWSTAIHCFVVPHLPEGIDILIGLPWMEGHRASFKTHERSIEFGSGWTLDQPKRSIIEGSREGRWSGHPSATTSCERP